ncbi:MAG: 16S rRNA (uracil(1498)-N(3))-methyltransferase [Kiritimatiellae bacterium]|nr:16S rRNA (uracil(1498)-N(3))-methyltransferase [Kiritimatiellia bacterium]
MNRILFEPGEIADGIATFGGARAEHVVGVLHGEVGQVLKTGEIGGMNGSSEILEIARDAAGGPLVRVRVSHEEAPLPSWIDLVLAPPRPRAMKRLLPQLATLGVGRIVLVGAQKVEKDFWGATLLKEENYRPLLVDGLMQAGTGVLPTLETRRSFRRFLRDELDSLFPTANRIVAHPSSAATVASASAVEGRPLLAVGPEGGWTDAEVELLESRGFRRLSLGPRVLRTDTAVVALLSRLAVQEREQAR